MSSDSIFIIVFYGGLAVLAIVGVIVWGSVERARERTKQLQLERELRTLPRETTEEQS